MKTFFNKKIRMFGKAVNLSLILVLILVVGVAAAYLWVHSTNVSITANTGPTMEMSMTGCTVISGPGIITECSTSGLTGTVIGNDFDDDSVLKISYLGINDSTSPVVTSWALLNSPAAISFSECHKDGIPCTGTVIQNVSSKPFDVFLEFGGLLSGETVNDIQFEFSFDFE